MIECIEVFNRQESFKRFEENIKFVFKLALKKMKSKFSRTRRFLRYSRHTEKFFYRYYFSTAAETLKIPIADFYDPLNNKIESKTINKIYLSRVLSVKNFRKDFIDYLGSRDFKIDYQFGVRSKLLKLLERFEGLFRDSTKSKKVDLPMRIRKYFQKNKQCKLPWTEREIDSSVYDFYSVILDK